MAHTGQFETYRLRAAQCTKLAQDAADSNAKLILLDMAQAWMSLAAQADKNNQTTLVYETPEPPQHVAQQQQQPQPDDPDKKELTRLRGPSTPSVGGGTGLYGLFKGDGPF